MFIKNEKVEFDVLGGGIKRKLLSRGGNLMLVELTFEKGAVSSVHSHQYEQANYVLSGSFEFDLNGSKQVMKEGDSVYVSKNSPHAVVALEDDSMLMGIFTPQRDDFLKNK